MKESSFSGSQLIIKFKDVRCAVIHDTSVDVITGQQRVHMSGLQASQFIDEYNGYLSYEAKKDHTSLYGLIMALFIWTVIIFLIEKGIL